MKTAEKISFGILVAFAIIGSLVTSIAVHEYSHAQDFNEIAENGEICALVLPQTPADLLNSQKELGYFSFTYPLEKLEQVEQIKTYTETKAYSFAAIPLIILAVSIFALAVAKLR